MNSGTDMRRHTRYEVEGIEGSFVFSLDVRVVNLSVSGMAVETSGRLNLGRSYSFKLRDGDAEVAIPGRVVWCVLGHTRRAAGGEVAPVYRAGVEFDNVLTDKAQVLVRLIEENAAVRLEKRVFGRFKLEAGEGVSVASQVDFTVRKLSLSGMLVETDFPVTKDSRFPLELRLEDEVVSAIGRVAYVEPQGQQKGREVAHLGFEFIELSKPARVALERFIASEAQAAGAAPAVVS